MRAHTQQIFIPFALSRTHTHTCPLSRIGILWAGFVQIFKVCSDSDSCEIDTVWNIEPYHCSRFRSTRLFLQLWYILTHLINALSGYSTIFFLVLSFQTAEFQNQLPMLYCWISWSFTDRKRAIERVFGSHFGHIVFHKLRRILYIFNRFSSFRCTGSYTMQVAKFIGNFLSVLSCKWNQYVWFSLKRALAVDADAWDLFCSTMLVHIDVLCSIEL